MRKAYIFQHKYGNVQIFVYNADSISVAKVMFKDLVKTPEFWEYIGEKAATSIIDQYDT